MASVNTVEADVRPKYYEVYGQQIANGNRAWLLAFTMAAVAFMAVSMAIFVRIQPPTVIRDNGRGESVVLGKAAIIESTNAATGKDEYANEGFIQRFLDLYQNYDPATVDTRWSNALNMMTQDLNRATYDALKATPAIRTQIDDEQIQSVFHLNEIDPVPTQPLTYTIYGTKEVHHIKDGVEVTDKLVDEYHIRLKTEQRSKKDPDGLRIAEYSERNLYGERIDKVAAAIDADPSNK